MQRFDKRTGKKVKSSTGLPAADVVGNAEVVCIERVAHLRVDDVKVALINERLDRLDHIGVDAHALLVEKDMVTPRCVAGDVKRPGGAVEVKKSGHVSPCACTDRRSATTVLLPHIPRTSQPSSR